MGFCSATGRFHGALSVEVWGLGVGELAPTFRAWGLRVWSLRALELTGSRLGFGCHDNVSSGTCHLY